MNGSGAGLESVAADRGAAGNASRKARWFRSLRMVCGLVLGVALAPPASAALIDHGPGGAYFRDTVTGLYWFDPDRFVGQTLAEIQGFIASHPSWSWAKPAQIDALAGKSTLGGVPLESVMGARQYTLTGGGPRWVGYVDPADVPPLGSAEPDGWSVQALAAPDTIDGTGWQADAALFPEITGVGAWLVTTIDPGMDVPAPATAALLAIGVLAGSAIRRRSAEVGSRQPSP